MENCKYLRLGILLYLQFNIVINLKMASAPEREPHASTSSNAGTITTSIQGDGSIIIAPIAGEDVIINQSATPNETLEGVCGYLRKMLEARYKRIKIPKMPWIDYNQDLPLKHYYVDLTVTQKHDFIHRWSTREIQLKDIFKPDKNRKPTRILVEGPGGYGKSMLALKLCYDYSENEDYLKEYELVILICLRDHKASTIDEMLAKQLTLKEYNSQTIFEAVRKHQKSVLIILDGYDESNARTRENLHLVLKSEHFSATTVIVTSRPGVISKIDDFDKLIDIKGVNGDNRSQFLQLHLKSCSEEQKKFLREYLYKNFKVSFGDESIFIKFVRWPKTLFLKDKENLLSCPLFLLLVVVVIKNSYPNVTLLRTKTDLYKILLNFVVQRTFTERLGSEQKVDLFQFNSDSPPNYVRSIGQFGKLALDKLKAKEFVFTKEEIISHCDDNIIFDMGLLTEIDCGEDEQHRTFWYQPIHLSILEFCAAFYLWYCFKCQQTTFFFPNKFMPDESGKTEMFVLPFFFGLCGDMLPVFIHFLKCDTYLRYYLKHIHVCESIKTETTFDLSGLINLTYFSLNPLYTSELTKYCSTSELLKMVVAECLRSHKVKCITFNSDLDWDICMGKGRLCVPFIYLCGDRSTHCLQNIHAFEIRVSLRWFENKDYLLALAKTTKASVISLLKEDDNDQSPLLSLFDSDINCEVFVITGKYYKLRVTQAKGEGSKAVGKYIERFEPLYKTEIVKRRTAGDEESCSGTRLKGSTRKEMTFVKINLYDNMNCYWLS